MTEECRIKYIQHLQCKYADLVQSLTDKLKLGRQCKELETRMLIVRDYLKSLYCYKGATPEMTVYRMEIINPGYGFYTTLTVTFSINGFPGIVYSGSNTSWSIDDILDGFEALTGLPDGFQVVVDRDNNYVYFYSETAPNPSVIIGGADYEVDNVIGTTPFPVTLVSSGEPIVLDQINCLTTEEICTITHHAMELVEDCNC